MYWNIKMFVQMAEGDIFMFTWAARNQEYLLRLFLEKQNRNMDLHLKLLETIMSEQFLPIWQMLKRRNKLQI